MTEGTQVKRVFAKTYSKENRIYRSWRADAVRPVPFISSCKNLRAVEEHVPVPSNSPVSSDSSVTTESNSSLYSDSTQFMSLSQNQSPQKASSRSTHYDSSSTLDGSEQEVTLKNPNAPYRKNKKIHYSIIIEESDDTSKSEAPARKGSSSVPAQKTVRNLPKSSSVPVRNVQKTKMMKDSLLKDIESDQGGLSYFDLDSSSISLIDEDDRNSSDYISSNQEESSLGDQQCLAENPPYSLPEENLEISDIEVMRDAPCAKSKGKGEKKDLSHFLKISAAKIYPQQERKVKKTIPQRGHKSKDRKNSTLNEIKSAKNIQEISFCEEDISHIPAYPTSECAFGDNSSSTFKGARTSEKTPPAISALKEIHSNIRRDSPSTLTKTVVNKVNIIRTPKRHNIKKGSVCSVPSPLESEIAKQVSFHKAANDESLYEPGSILTKDPPPIQLPQLSPSLSILKKASTLELHSQEENTESLPRKATSTPLSKRKSKHLRPSKMAFSFDVSAVPLPSYDNDDLMAPLPPTQETVISKGYRINKEGVHIQSSCISRHITPSKQVKRDSPEPSIPSRPLKRRRSHILPSSSDTDQEFSNKTSTHKSKQPGQKKRLEYKDKGVGPPKCVVTILPDVHFQKVRKASTNFSPGPLDLSFLNNVPEDIITTLPDSMFS